MELDNFRLLEARLRKIIQRFERVQTERDKLLRSLEEKQREIKELEGRLRSAERGRAEVRERLQRVLARVESLEASWGSA